MSTVPEHPHDEPPANGGRNGRAVSHRRTLIYDPAGPMQEVLNKVDRFARIIDRPVIIIGKSGTGKENIAHLLHEGSPLRDKPFVAINCAAISPNLIESELFGHEKGSFTGADRQHIGAFERANGGTLFLDEIGEMPPEMQVKLLRTIQENEIIRVGGGKEPIKVNPRIISATNRNPVAAIREGKLRRDLYYRLRGTEIRLPPLRERKTDIPLLARHFAAKAVAPYEEFTKPEFSETALNALQEYHWPGNVRELDSRVSEAAIIAQDSPDVTITREILHLPVRKNTAPRSVAEIKADISKLFENEKGIRNDRRLTSVVQGNRGTLARFFNPENMALPNISTITKLRDHCRENGTETQFDVLIRELMSALPRPPYHKGRNSTTDEEHSR